MDLKALIAQSQKGPTLSERTKQALDGAAKPKPGGLIFGQPKAGNSTVAAPVPAQNVSSNGVNPSEPARTDGNAPKKVGGLIFGASKAGMATAVPGSASAAIGSPAPIATPPSQAVVTNPAPTELSARSEAQLAAELQQPHQTNEFTAQAVEQFRHTLDVLKANLDQPAVVGQAIRHVMQTLKDNPQFESLLLPEDMGMMVRGLRTSYQTVIIVKESKQKKTKAKTEDVNSAIDLMKDMKF